MPALPKLGDRAGTVGRIEVTGQIDAKHFCSARRDVAVAGEVKVELEGIGQHGHEGGRAGQAVYIVPSDIDRASQGVSQQYLFCQTIADERQAVCQPLPVQPAAGRGTQLREDLAVEGDGAAHDIGEEGDKKRVFVQGIPLGLALVGVD